ncbi:shikimate kinase [Jeotgalibacillus sp. R-1-5s-1]|uniref:shikimate kinase n=1 Tax=Jeotgalibacillus sp. R-1-5s-1 TaxID=2555897 RepID=UPI00141AEACD|nr:shikimate kinase [Jeotgalibacillus sp. R-1-5s-1]
MMKSERVFLIGFMGAGKSTAGKLAADRLSHPFIDLDQYIEEREKRSIPDIFKADGEVYFRTLEAGAIKEIGEPSVTATGGGILYDPKTGEWMRNHGLVIYLHAPFEELYTRISGDHNRPVAATRTKEELEELYQKRHEQYQDVAHVTLSVDGVSPDITADQIRSAVMERAGI